MKSTKNRNHQPYTSHLEDLNQDIQNNLREKKKQLITFMKTLRMSRNPREIALNPFTTVSLTLLNYLSIYLKNVSSSESLTEQNARNESLIIM